MQVIRIACGNESPGEPREAFSETWNYGSMIFHQDNREKFLEPIFTFYWSSKDTVFFLLSQMWGSIFPCNWVYLRIVAEPIFML